MNLVNFENAIVAAGILLTALFTQQARADYEYLYCATATHYKSEFPEISDQKTLSANLSKIARIYRHWYDGKNYLLFESGYSWIPHTGATFHVKKNVPLMNEQEAKDVCKEIQSFCRIDYKHVGGRKTLEGLRYTLSLPFQGAGVEGASTLICPNWRDDQRQGLILSPDQMHRKSAEITY